MKPEALGPAVLPVSVVLPMHRHEFAEDARVREAVGSYCQDLAASLDLPVQVEVTVSPTGTDRRVRVVVGKSTVSIEDPEERDIDTCTLAVCRAIYRGRECLVTEEVAHRVWIEWFPDRASSVDEAPCLRECIWLLKEATRCGLRAGHLRNAIAAADAGLLDHSVAERVFEESAGQLGPTSVRLFLSRAQHGRCFNGDDAIPLVGEDQDLPNMFETMADELFGELGILYRLEAVEVDEHLNEPWFRVQWNDVLVPPVKGLASDEFLVSETVDRLTLLNLKGSPTINPAKGTECAILRGGEDIRRIAVQAGLTTWGPERYLVLHASSEIRSNAEAFMNLSLFDFLIAQLAQTFPDLVDEAISRLGRVRLCRILRLLAKERVSVRDLRTILDGLLAVDGITSVDVGKFMVFSTRAHFPCPTRTAHQINDLQPEDYADCARMALRRYLSHKHIRGGNTLVAYLVDPVIEERLSAQTPLSTSVRDALLDAVFGEVSSLPSTAATPPILTTFAARRRLRGVIEQAFPSLAVLSYQELQPNMNIQPIARIAWHLERP